jgi:hypothetical protein
MLAAALLLVGTAFERRPPAAWTARAAPRPSAAQSGTRQGSASVAGVLNEDGSLRPGVNGSFDPKGFRMELSPSGAPRFVAEPTCSGWDTQFTPNGMNGPVTAVTVSGTDIYVGGDFTAIGEGTANHVARFDTTTNTWSTLGTDGSGVDGTVNALAVIGSTLYVGGYFQQANVGGTTVVTNNLAKFDTTTNTWSTLGTDGNGVSGHIYAFAVMGSTLYIGGEYYLLKFDTATNTWDHSIPYISVGGPVYALAVSGSTLYVGGGFSQANVGGTAVAANNVARFDTATNTWSGLGSDGNGVDYIVQALAVSGSTLYVGGSFTQANVGGTAVAVHHVARFDTTTNTWSKLGTDGNGVTDYYTRIIPGRVGSVSALAVIGSTLYVGGYFQQANYGGTVVAANNVAKLDTTTNTWGQLGTNANVVSGYNPVAFAVSGDTLYAVGQFTPTAVGETPYPPSSLMRLDAATNTWSRIAGKSGNGLNGPVTALAASGTDIYVGGNFTAAGNIAVNRVARFDTATNTWSKLGTDGNGVNGTVSALAVIGSTLYVGGDFTQASYGGTAVAVNHVARFDTATNTWSQLGTDGNGVTSGVTALAVIGSSLFVGGVGQANVGGTAVAARGVARFDTTTNTWSKLGSDGSGVDGAVYALAVSGSTLYVGGSFTQANYGGTAVAVNNVARFDTTTNTWSKLGTDGDGVNGGVSALAVSGSSLFVGGHFTQANVGGTAVNVEHVARFDTATNTWSKLNTDDYPVLLGVFDEVHALAASGSMLYVGGSFQRWNNDNRAVAVNFVVRFDTATDSWSTLSTNGLGVNGTVNALAVSGSSLWVGGSFYMAGDGTSSQNIARLCDAMLPAVEFTSSLYTVAERGGSVTITVRRNGDLSLPVTVNYSTDDGNSPSAAASCSATTGQALERCDYERAAGTLRFAAGEAEKSFVVLVNDDSYVEGIETTHLRLSNPSDSATLGGLSSAGLLITDDATESAGNPVDDPAAFVRQHYLDFLNREPDAPGLAFWTDQMTHCGNPNLEVCRVNVSAAFFQSIEFQNTGYLVERIYKAAYGDATGNSTLGGAHQLSVPVVRLDQFMRDTRQIGHDVVVGQSNWQAQLEANKQAYALEFVRRPEFLARYPAQTGATAFVNLLDQNAGGVLSPDEKTALIGELSPNSADAALRASVVREVAEDADLVGREFDRAFVLMEYFGYLRRDPDAPPDADHTGYDFWLRKLDQFDGDFVRAEMVKAFLNSDEYRKRFAQ